MNKIFLVAMQHVRQIAFWKPFLLAMLAGPPILFLGAMAVSGLLGSDFGAVWNGLPSVLQTQITRGVGSVENVGYVDYAGILRVMPDEPAYRHWTVFRDEFAAQRALGEKSIVGYYVIPADYVTSGAIAFYSDSITIDATNDALLERWLILNLAHTEEPARLKRIIEPVQETTSQNPIWDMTGIVPTPEITNAIPIAGVFIFGLIFAGNLLLTPLARERQGRILDVVLGSVSPAQFVIGKYLGALIVAAMLLTSWFSWDLILTRGNHYFSGLDGAGALAVAVLSTSGFLMYAALLTVFGAWVELYPESNRIPMIVGAVGVAPLVLCLLTNTAPNDGGAIVMSLIPFFAPTLLIWRIELTPVPPVEIASALALMWLTTIFFLWLAVFWFQREMLLETRKSFWRRAMGNKFLVWGIFVVWGITLLYFVLRPTSEMMWTDLLVALLSAVLVGIWMGLRARRFAAWRALGLLLLAQILGQIWLQWQWNLWTTPWQNVNALAALLTFDSFVAILVVSVLLLIRRDASVLALGVVWFGCPLGLLLTMAHYSTAAQIDNLPLRDSSILFTAMCFLGFLALAGSIAFAAHFMRLLYLELAGKV